MDTQKKITEDIKKFLYEDEKNKYAFAVIVDEKEENVTQIMKGESKDLVSMLGAVMCQCEDFRDIILAAVGAYHKMSKMDQAHADC